MQAAESHSGRQLLFGQLLSFQGMWHHVTLSQKMRLALPANISLTWLTSSEVLPCAHRADMSLDIFQRSQLAKVRSPPLFEQHRDRGKLQGVWGKTPIGKPVCKLRFCKQEEKSTWSTDDPYSRSICLFQSMWALFFVNDQPHVFEGTCYEAS